MKDFNGEVPVPVSSLSNIGRRCRGSWPLDVLEAKVWRLRGELEASQKTKEELRQGLINAIGAVDST